MNFNPIVMALMTDHKAQILFSYNRKNSLKILLQILTIPITVIKHTRSDCVVLMLHFDA